MPKSLPNKGSRNPAHKFWYHRYTYPTLNSGEPDNSTASIAENILQKSWTLWNQGDDLLIDMNAISLWLLLKNKEDLNTDELAKLELVLKQSERLREAYELKEKF